MQQESLLDGSHLPSWEKLAGYIFFTATGQEFDPAETDPDTGFIGRTASHDVFLFYEPDVDKLKSLALSLAEARALPEGGSRKKARLRAYQVPGSRIPSPVPNRLPAVALPDLRSDRQAGTMILKEYQKRTLATVRGFVAELAKWRAEDEEARKHNPNWGSDWVGTSVGGGPSSDGGTTPAATGSASVFPPSASRSRPAVARHSSPRA